MALGVLGRSDVYESTLNCRGMDLNRIVMSLQLHMRRLVLFVPVRLPPARLFTPPTPVVTCANR